MRAAIVDRFEALGDIAIRDVPKPLVKSGHVLIAVKAAGAGYVDALGALGRYQVKQPLPFVPGGEYAGVITEVGEDVTGLAQGDRVMAGGFAGGYAEFALAPAGAVLPMPDVMDFITAAGFRTNYATALHALQDRAAIKPGETLLVLGAAAAPASRRFRSASCWEPESSPPPRRPRNAPRRWSRARTRSWTIPIRNGATR